MLKGALAGFAAGLVVAAIAYRSAAPRAEIVRIEATPAPTAESRIEAPGAEPVVATPVPEAPRPEAPVAAPPRVPLRDLARELGRLRTRFKGGGWDDWPREARGLQSRIVDEMSALAAELGISVDEASRSPDGLALLAAELLAQLAPSDPGQEARLKDLLAAERPAWERWRAARENASVLESRREFLDHAGRLRASFLAALDPAQRGLLRDVGLLDGQIQGSQVWFDGPRETVTRDLSARWTSALDLDERQAAAVAPIVREYIDQARDLNNRIWARRRAGEELSREADYALRLDLMIATQRRLAATAALNPDQWRALKEWQFTYGANVTDERE